MNVFPQMVFPLVEWNGLHEILRDTYEQMAPMCKDLTGLATGLAGLGALLYIAYRVWQALARAEPVDVFPLLRPFALAICIVLFKPLVLDTLCGVLNPLVRETHQMMRDQVFEMKKYQAEKDRVYWDAKVKMYTLGVVDPSKDYDRQLAELGIETDSQATFDAMYSLCNMFSLKHWILEGLRWLLEVLFETAALVVDTLRTFYLVVLSIIGPLAFAFAVFDGFQATLTHWLSRFITIYLWLPVSDLFSAMLARIQIISLNHDIESAEMIDFSGADTTYIVFMIIGIVGYFSVPTVASWIVRAGSGAGGYQKTVNSMANKAGNVVTAAAGAAMGNAGGLLVGKGK